MGKKTIAALIVLALLGVAGFFGWRFYSSPQSSPLEVREAAEQRGAAASEKDAGLDGRKAHPDRTIELPGLATDVKPLVLSYIPSGEFMMGSPSNETHRGEDEGPRHRVNITRAFWMGKYEVTNAQFEAFVKATGYVTTAEKDGNGFSWDATDKGWGIVNGVTWRKPGFPWEPQGSSADHPVVMVSWEDATAFCQWLSGAVGESITLPTEAQWEYACRAGSTSQYWWGDSQQSACQFANVFNQENKGSFGMNWPGFPCSDGYLGLSPVGSFQPNAFGLHDTTGNVWEWCADWYDEGYYASSPKDDPVGPAEGSSRVSRGGCWLSVPVRCRSAYRGGNTSADRLDHLGFRLAASPAGR